MLQPDEMLWDVEIDDPAVEAALAALIAAEEMAALVRAETEVLESETRQVLKANHVLMEAACLPSLEAAQAAIMLARRWRL